MLRALACFIVFLSWTSPAGAEEIAKTFKTAGDAILCLTADMLPQALEAAKTEDRAYIHELGCFPIFANVPARRIDTRKSSAVWRVRLEPKGAAPVNAWGYNDAFRSDAGDRLDKDGHPEKARK